MSRAVRRGIASLAATVAVVLLPAMAFAHPLGNFTINHYAGLRVEPDRIVLDVVIDQAEVPAFQARLAYDTDGDRTVSDEEVDAGRLTACADLAPDLRLTADGAAVPLRLMEASLSFPVGTGGLSTLRLDCGFEATLPATLSTATATRIAFSDSSYEERLGWREIVVVGSGTALTVVEGSQRDSSPSNRLTEYPEALVSDPLADESVTLDAIAVGPGRPVEDALGAAPGSGENLGAATGTSTTAPVGAAIPGGVEGDLPAIFGAANVTPIVLLVSVVTAALLGAAHALTPGHGKTLMAAYLVGTRGTPRHALGLGLSVSVSHTVGILVLATVVVAAADVLPPDLVIRGAPVVAAVSILAIGAWMLLEQRRRRFGVADERAHAAAHASGHEHDHGHEHEHEHDHHHGHEHEHDGSDGHPHGEHRHGGVSHRHLPRDGASITWRSLFVLGLAGGLIPSTSALLILLGSIAAGRPGFGFVLVVAFGAGMAMVMAGIGLLIVAARDRAEHLSVGRAVGRVGRFVPLAAAVFVFGVGLYLTAQALASTPSL